MSLYRRWWFMHSMNLTQLEEINTLVKHSAVRKKNPLVTHHRRPIGLSKNLLIMRYFNWLCCRVWVHVHCFFQRSYPLDNDIIFPVALPFAKKKKKNRKNSLRSRSWKVKGIGRKENRQGPLSFPLYFPFAPSPFPSPSLFAPATQATKKVNRLFARTSEKVV